MHIYDGMKAIARCGQWLLDVAAQARRIGDHTVVLQHRWKIHRLRQIEPIIAAQSLNRWARFHHPFGVDRELAMHAIAL